jgi:hypothetical protein
MKLQHQEVLDLPQPVTLPAPLLPFGLHGVSITLRAGTSKRLPTDDSSAIRIRALPKADMFGAATTGEILLALEVTHERHWPALRSLRVEKALDDQDQDLAQMMPQVLAALNAFGIAPTPGVARPILFPSGQQLVPVRLKKGQKVAKLLKEFKGVIEARFASAVELRVVADNLDRAAGKTFKGDAGGLIKIIDVTTDREKNMTIQLELEEPPNTVQHYGLPEPGSIFGGKRPPFVGPIHGMFVMNDDGKPLPLRCPQLRTVPRPDGKGDVITCTLVCRAGKDRATRLVYSTNKPVFVDIDIPFTMKDVPLP